jgi:RimJ/RimL family protein N-acetyltransferase
MVIGSAVASTRARRAPLGGQLLAALIDGPDLAADGAVFGMPGAGGRGTIAAMSPCRWPLARLRLHTPQLELRLPTASDLEELAELAARGVHDPDVQPFIVPWTDAAPEERALGTMQHQWSLWASWKPSDWILSFAVVRDGAVVGTQQIGAHNFTVLRQVKTAAWLGRGYQGRGIGSEMRAAVLHLAFEGLGAEHAVSGAFEYNAASLGVSRKLGYRDDGISRHAVRGRPVVERRLRLTRSDWLAARSVPVEIEGLGPCLPLFGLPGPALDADHQDA